MNESERSELEQLKQRHARLEQELAQLAAQLKRLESGMPMAAPEASAPQAAGPVSEPTTPAPQPAPPAAPPGSAAPPVPPPIPLVIREHAASSTGRAAEFLAQLSPATAAPEARSSEAALPRETALSRPEAPPPAERSFEMRLGTYWLVRIGVVMLLTGLVFFGNYAYQNFIIRLGPAGKVALLYVASGILLGAGTWWQRRAVKESLRNYAQVLFAGGLAAMYFTTYAAHHLETLRVIRSALLDGSLLMLWAAFMVRIADRKRSEVLALFAVGLAYYTSVMTRVGSFTLYSNLLLTVAAVFFLVRNRWAGLTFASLVATYAAYGFWRFFDGTHWHWTTPEQGLWHGTYFLICYWLVFTAAVFLSRHGQFAGTNRATFATLNNVGFFVLYLLTMLQVHEARLWQFSLSYGAALLACAESARRFVRGDALTKHSYLTQGLVLVTVGLIAKYNGLQLALLLGAESVVLLTLGVARKSFILQTGSYFCGAMAAGYGIDGLERDDWHGLLLETTIGVMMAFNAFWSARQGRQSKAPVRAVPGLFTVLALISWFAATWFNTSAANFPLALAVEALVLTFSVYLLRLREFVWFGQGYLVIAQCLWVYRFSDAQVVPPWWNPALLIVMTLALSHWWPRQKRLAVEPALNQLWLGLYALAVIGVVHFWLEPLVSARTWLALTSLLGVGITVYAVVTRAWPLALGAQILVAVGAVRFAMQLAVAKPAWYLALAPLAALVFLSLSTVQWFQRRPGADARIRDPLLQLALVYRWVGLVMSLAWVCKYIDAREQIWVLALLGLLMFLWAGWRKNNEGLLFSAAFTALGLGLFWQPFREVSTVYWPNLFAIPALLAQQHTARRLPDRYRLEERIHGALVLAGGLSVWLLLTRWIQESETGGHAAGVVIRTGSILTASWAALALVLFACGVALRERMYRWLGLGVLAGAVVRAFVVDVWKLESLYRILSFVALGLALMVLGFIYIKYQEKIKEWL